MLCITYKTKPKFLKICTIYRTTNKTKELYIVLEKKFNKLYGYS